MKTLKLVIQATEPQTFDELERFTDHFLLQYRNAEHFTTKHRPASLFKGRTLRSVLQSGDTADVTFFKGNDVRPSTGIILHSLGQRMVVVMDLEDGTCHRRHIDQVRIHSPCKPLEEGEDGARNDP